MDVPMLWVGDVPPVEPVDIVESEREVVRKGPVGGMKFRPLLSGDPG